jgi:hypothetical protein
VFPGSVNSLHWGLEDPAEADGTDEERLAAFRLTRHELTLRLRPFVEIARRTAGLPIRTAGETEAAGGIRAADATRPDDVPAGRTDQSSSVG